MKLTKTNYFAKKGVRAECIKLNGAVELAPKLKICSTIVDLVSTGKTLSENNLEESNLVMQISSKLIINKIAYIIRYFCKFFIWVIFKIFISY